MEKKILSVPIGTKLPPAKRKELREAGFIVIEVPKGETVTVQDAELLVKPNSFLMAALHGCSFSSTAQTQFASELLKRLQEIEKKKPNEQQ